MISSFLNFKFPANHHQPWTRPGEEQQEGFPGTSLLQQLQDACQGGEGGDGDDYHDGDGDGDGGRFTTTPQDACQDGGCDEGYSDDDDDNG